MNIMRIGEYSAQRLYDENAVIRRVLNAFIDGTIPNIVYEGREIFDSLIKYNDEYFLLRDFDSYVEAQKEIDKAYGNQTFWQKMSLINIANAGRFSSDETVSRYAEDIWKIESKDSFVTEKG